MNKLNYLIFDDHPLVCVAIKSLLEELGKTNGVFTATSAKMALQIFKSENHDILKDAIEAVEKGYTFFKFKQVVNSVREMPQLSSRESAVMKYLLQGKSNREIASVLSISDKTVSTYKRRLLDKFNVKNIVELTRVAGA
ncbi:response regulator transcription factor [Vibrio alginolyticus]|uniref:response regulator transcription factor n=1 Tax=Vibrio alginolyticus TaxID=663 RepID=UPI0006CA63FC|nr:LuxR C-terminal-related transcriptional regulator [Vibrio alginolyticus]KPM99704.1 hypothetical protein AOG25_04340 [Vibrio alginolyticus]